MPQGGSIALRECERKRSECHVVTTWIPVASATPTTSPDAKAGRRFLGPSHERTQGIDSGGKAHDDGANRWCVLRRCGGMVGHRSAIRQPQRSTTSSAYRAGVEGRPMEQGESLATSADLLL